MNKEELIERIKFLEESLPEGLKTTENAVDVINDLNEYTLSYGLSLAEEQEAAMEYDEEAFEKEDSLRASLENDLQQLEVYRVNINNYQTEVERDIKKLEMAINAAPNRLAYLDSVSLKYDNNFTDTPSYLYNKNNILKEKENFAREIENKKRLLAQKQQELEKIKVAFEINRSSIEECSSDLERTNSRINEIRTANQIPERRMEKHNSNLALLNTMSNYFNANPKEKLSKLASDLDAGIIDETEANQELQTIKSMLTSNIYNVKDVNAKLSPNQIEEKKKELETQVEALNTRLVDLDAVPNSEELQTYYDENSLIESEITDLERSKSKYDRSIVKNDEKIRAFEEENDRLKTLREKYEVSSELSDSVKKVLTEDIGNKIFENENEIEILKIKNKTLANRSNNYNSQIEVYNSKINSNKVQINNLLIDTQVNREIEREKITKELNATKAMLTTIELNGESFEESFEKGLDELINLTGGETLENKGGILLPAFTENFTPKQMKIYEELLNDLTEEEKAEVIENVDKKLEEVPEEEVKKTIEKIEKSSEENPELTEETPEKEPMGLVPIGNPEIELFPVPDGERHKVNRFKTLAKEKVDKIKDWFKNNWKKVVLVAETAILIAALAFTGKCSKGSTKVQEPTVSPQVVELTVPYEEAQKDIPDPIPYPVEETPEVTPVVEDNKSKKDTPSKPSTPSTPDTPVTPETPDPGVTPEPITPEPSEEVVNEYVLTKEAPDGTGDSAFADPTEPQLQGESVYNPVTNTWIDSQGTKVTQTEDGEFLVEPNAEDVTAVDEDRNKIVNPDMTPIEEEQKIPEDAQSFEEAVKDGTLSAAEAQEYQNFFDDLFNEMEEEQGRSR